MGIKLKLCADCGQQRMIGKSKSRCKLCRVADPEKFSSRPSGSAPRYKQKKKVRATVGLFVNWRACHLPKCVFPENKDYSTTSLGKRQRNFVLKSYGYNSYIAYLKSDLWASIRSQVLQGANCVCGCGRSANQVHHKAYTEANLMGASLDSMVPINDNCHYLIEFSDDRKVNLGDANRELKTRQSRN